MPDTQPKRNNLYYLFCDAQGPPMPAERIQAMLSVLLEEYDRVFPPPQQDVCCHPP